MDKNTIILRLVEILGLENVLTDDESKAFFGKDHTQNCIPNPMAIVFPQTENQVVDIVNLANQTITPLVPSGGRTGYSGAAVALSQELVVSFNKMNRILAFNAEDRSVRCEPGVITKTLQNFALEKNLLYPVDFASSGSSQIGGNIATNAGGIKVIRYGPTRNWVTGLRVVTGNGDILQLNNGLVKNNTGYDFRNLFIGSEGTLGFITEATLKLTQPPEQTKVVLFAIPHVRCFISILDEFCHLASITALEFFSEVALHYVLSNLQILHPFSSSAKYYVLLEYESNNASDLFIINKAQYLLDRQIVHDAIISETNHQAQHLWKLRENISISLRNRTPYKYDIAIVPSKIPAFVEEVDQLISERYPNIEIIWFGHMGDGNLHLNLLKPYSLPLTQFFQQCERLSDEVYALVHKYHGSVSAEHGIGLLKKEYLKYTKSEKEITYMRLVKKIFDQNNIMNPGKIFD